MELVSNPVLVPEYSLKAQMYTLEYGFSVHQASDIIANCV